MTKTNKATDHPAPRHLSRRATGFWDAINAKYVLEKHDTERLRVACEAMDQIDAAEAAIRKSGLMIPDRYGGVRQHPAINVARDARGLLLRAIREMNIDIETPTESRVPRQQRRYS